MNAHTFVAGKAATDRLYFIGTVSIIAALSQTTNTRAIPQRSDLHIMQCNVKIIFGLTYTLLIHLIIVCQRMHIELLTLGHNFSIS